MRSLICRASYIWVVILLFVCVFKAFFAYADDSTINPATNPEKDSKKIHITSDRLIADNEAMFAEFIGNVVAIRGSDVLTSDRLKIFYKRSVDNKEKPVAGEEMIQKIVANGNVVIKFDDKVAVTQQAVYTAETGIIVLTGPNSKVTSGNNCISGEKITMYRSDDRMIVESGKEKQVEAVFYSKDNVTIQPQTCPPLEDSHR
ncbi:MAG: LptA/OstA family protein [Desulfobacterales bacterium]